jgi:hypothetical protein
LKEPQNVVTTYTPEQVRVLIQWKPASKNFYHRRLHLLILTLLDCGLRISEALHLHVRDVSMDDLLLLVTGKGSKQRRGPFSFELGKRIYKFVADFHLSPDTLLFCTRDHTMLDKNIVRRDVNLQHLPGIHGNPPAIRSFVQHRFLCRATAFDYYSHFLFGTPVPVIGTCNVPSLVGMFSVADSDASSEGLNLTAMVQCFPAARVERQNSS